MNTPYLGSCKIINTLFLRMSHLTSLLIVPLLLPCVSALSCIGCTSDPSSPNWPCLGGTSADSPGNGTIDINMIADMSVECEDEEAEYCFTMVTWEPPFLDQDHAIQNKVRIREAFIKKKKCNICYTRV